MRSRTARTESASRTRLLIRTLPRGPPTHLARPCLDRPERSLPAPAPAAWVDRRSAGVHWKSVPGLGGRLGEADRRPCGGTAAPRTESQVRGLNRCEACLAEFESRQSSA